MARVFSGIQPTGDKHLGNLLGAIRHWVAAQDHDDALYCVVDLHAMTVPYDPKDLAARTRSTAALLLAAGLDPQRCTLFVQSHVAAHTELTWILNCVATFGELRRMTQFKDKSAGQESVSVGLLDQRQHLELSRDLAVRFNHRFGPTLVVPEPAIPPVAARIMDLQNPTAKMSTTAESPLGTIGLLDPPEVLSKRIRAAVTDSGTDVRFDPDTKPGVSNLLQILAAATDRTIPDVEADVAGGGYGTLKQTVADAVIEFLTPLQERYRALAADPSQVDAALATGAAKAEAVSTKVLRRVRDAVGLLPRP